MLEHIESGFIIEDVDILLVYKELRHIPTDLVGLTVTSLVAHLVTDLGIWDFYLDHLILTSGDNYSYSCRIWH